MIEEEAKTTNVFVVIGKSWLTARVADRCFVFTLHLFGLPGNSGGRRGDRGGRGRGGRGGERRGDRGVIGEEGGEEVGEAGRREERR